MKQCIFLLAAGEEPAHAPHNKQLQRSWIKCQGPYVSAPPLNCVGM